MKILNTIIVFFIVLIVGSITASNLSYQILKKEKKPLWYRLICNPYLVIKDRKNLT